jgi:predicted anti-sigma-YlaC factor YlaD
VARRSDYLGMDCATAREAVSAVIDGEDPGADLTTVDGHLARCAACRQWRDSAHEVTRRARVAMAPTALQQPAEVARTVAAPGWGRRRRRAVALARLGLIAVAAGQLMLTVPMLLFGHDHSAPAHVAHEMGAFDAALAAGFLVAAWRPVRALGMRALVGVASALLVVTAVIDMAAGRTSAADEAPHLLAVAGWLLICYLAARTPPAAAARDLRSAGIQRSWGAWPARRGRRAAATGKPSARPASTAAAPFPDAAARRPVEQFGHMARTAGQLMPDELAARPEDVA